MGVSRETDDREVFMDEFREIRQEIKKDLAGHRREHREDIKDLHCKIDKRFMKLSEDFQSMSQDVARHKVQIGTFSTFVAVIAGSITAWFVSNFMNGGSA